MHGLVATCNAKSPCVLPVPIPQLLSFAQPRFCVRTRSGVESLCLAKQSCLAVVQEAMAATNSGPSDKALPLSLADRNWFKNLPWQIFSVRMKFGGNRCRDVGTHRF